MVLLKYLLVFRLSRKEYVHSEQQIINVNVFDMFGKDKICNNMKNELTII